MMILDLYFILLRLKQKTGRCKDEATSLPETQSQSTERINSSDPASKPEMSRIGSRRHVSEGDDMSSKRGSGEGGAFSSSDTIEPTVDSLECDSNLESNSKSEPKHSHLEIKSTSTCLEERSCPKSKSPERAGDSIKVSINLE